MLGESSDWAYVVVSDDPDAAALRHQLDTYATGEDKDGGAATLSSFFKHVVTFEPYGPDDRSGPGAAEFEEGLLDAAIWPSPTREVARQRVEEVKEIVTAEGGEVIAEDFRPQSTVVRCRGDVALRDKLLDSPVIERLRTPPAPAVDPSDWFNVDLDHLSISVRTSAPVGIIDDLVLGTHPLLSSVVKDSVGIGLDSQDAWRASSGHGTMVATVAACPDLGKQLAAGASVEVAGPLYAARVLESDGHGGSKFPDGALEHRAIESAIRKLNTDYGVRVFNVSINDREPFSGSTVSNWTETIDTLARELDVLIVVSAGNWNPVESDGAEAARARYPESSDNDAHRIAEPGIAVNAVVVGSIAHSDGSVSSGVKSRPGDRPFAAVDQLSPFSRRGPGAGTGSKGIKPDFVEVGGNWAVNDAGILEVNNVGLGVVTGSEAPDRLFKAASGTSLAAPAVARIAADAWHENHTLSANGVRALLGASARVPSQLHAQFPATSDRLDAAGYGRIERDRALQSGGNRVVLLHEWSIPVDTTMIYEIPIPEEYVKGISCRHITAALAFDPPVRSQRADYVAAHMRFWMYKNITQEQLVQIHGEQPDNVRTEMVDDARRLLNSPNRPAATLLAARWSKAKAGVSPDDGDTYYLVVQHRASPWAEQMHSDYQEQRFAVAVELEDETRTSLNLYELVRARLEARVKVRV